MSRIASLSQRTPGLATALLAAALLLLAVVSRAEPEWISPDGSPPGTPADFAVDPGQSSAQRSTLTLNIHGFWMEDVQGEDGNVYQKFSVPGMGSLNTPGGPDLPAFRTRLGVATTSEQAAFLGVEPIQEMSLDGVLPWPQPLEELEPVEGGRPERFFRDNRYYEGQGNFPPSPCDVADGMGHVGGVIPCADVVLQPFQWDKANARLTVATVAQWQIDHAGQPLNVEPINRDRLAMAEAMLPNWDVIGYLWPINWWYYDADYLIITPQAYLGTLQDFINLKKSQGYWVQVRFTENAGPTCEDYRAAIADWMNLAPASRDKYCLLVGDVDVIPTCTSPYLNSDYPEGVASDDPYGSPLHYDLDEEVYVGRLSVDDEADLAQQLDRIIHYQTYTNVLTNYNTVGLVAHKQDAPGKYVGAHESVRTAAYAHAPAFSTFYGNNAAVSDGDVVAAVNAGLGIVCYRGHGSSSAWTGWNTHGDYFDSADVGALTNTQTPVVWSLACTNARLSSSDCIGEIWMEQGDHGAASFYGATVASYTSENHELDRQLFQAVYTQDLNIHAQAVEYAEAQMAALSGSENAWMYLQLGDPSMRIKRFTGLDIQANLPETLPPHPWEINVQFVNLFDGQPIADAVFAVYKPSGNRDQGDEVFDNTYTDASGNASITVDPLTEGMLYWTLRGPNGEAVYDSIPVSDLTAVPEFGAETRLWAEPSVTGGASTLRLGRAAVAAGEITLYDVSGRAVRELPLSVGQSDALWDGRGTDGRKVPAGVYFARLREGDRERTTRITVLR